MNIPPLRSFRLVCKPGEVPALEALLAAQGFGWEEEPFFPLARRLLREPFSLGASLAAFFGYIYIQDRSSMLPPLALAPQPGDAVLDMCASPGSKTGLLGQMVGPHGFVLGNEPTPSRLATLRRNLFSLNLLCCATSSHPGERLPLPDASASNEGAYPGWGHIQLDPPCSGWGTVEKNPQVRRLWQGDKVKPLMGLQRLLLREAARLLRPGGKLVYSTCTTHTAENEEQVRFAVDELGLEFVPLEPLPGFSFAEAALKEFSGVLCVDTGADGQGFFVAALRKPGASPEPFKGCPVSLPPAKKSPQLTGFADLSTLPPGTVEVFGGVPHFLPQASAALVPAGFRWKGFPLGKLRPDGVRVSPALRVLMPPLEQALAAGLPCLNLEETAPLGDLISGKALTVSSREPEMGLYFQGLPLCRLTVKGSRALLPPLS